MSESAAYTQQILYTFTVDDYDWAVTGASPEQIHFEETRKNGQEDCHFGGWADLVDGQWVLEESTREDIEMYTRESTADALEAFFNEHGPPTPPE